MGFRNTSYAPPPSNWTVKPEVHEDDEDDDKVDGTGVIDLNNKDKKKEKKKVQTSE